MKNKTKICLVLILVLSVVSAGCVQNPNPAQAEEKIVRSYSYDISSNHPTVNICLNNVPLSYGNITDKNIIPIAQTHSRTEYGIAITFEGGQIEYVHVGDSIEDSKLLAIKVKLNCNLEPK